PAVSSNSAAPLPEQTVELLRRVRGGDRAATEELCARLWPRVRGLAAVRMGRSLVDFVDRDDIVQEAMLAALERIDRFEPRSEGGLVAWLAAIVHSRVADAHRAANTDKRGGGGVATRRSDLGITTLSRLPVADGATSPSGQLTAGEFDPAIERAL